MLERATLVTKERRGREQIVRADGRTIAKAIAFLDQYEQLWIDRAIGLQQSSPRRIKTKSPLIR